MWITDKIEDMLEDARMKAGSKEALTGFCYSYGGNMCGNSHREYVVPFDSEHAKISISHANWYYEDPAVSEYLVDIDIMNKLEAVFRKYSMEKWHGKKFTDIFVCDGESYSYGFDFEKAHISFSSQVFPGKYHEKLDELHKILGEYIEKGERLPYLLQNTVQEGEAHGRLKPEDGDISLEVCFYREGKLGYRICNGTDEKIEYDRNAAIYAAEESEAVEVKKRNYSGNVYQHSVDEDEIMVPGHLKAGKYRLEVGKYECGFEIVNCADKV